MMETRPSLRYIKLDHLIARVPEPHLVEEDGHILRTIQHWPVLRQSAHHENMVHDGVDGADELCGGRVLEGLAIHLDHPRQRERDVKHTDPRVRFVFDVVRCRPLVWVETHEQLARLRELHDVVAVVDNHLLDGRVVAKVAQVAKDGHETFGLEWGRVDVQYRSAHRRIDDPFIDNLVGEEGGDDGKETRDDLVVAHYVGGHRRGGEQLQGEIFDGCFRFVINQQVGVYDAMIDTRKVAGCQNIVKTVHKKEV